MYSSAGAVIDFNSGNDADAPDFAMVNGSLVIEYDDVSGNEDDDATIASTFTVPQDYASGGSFALRVSKDAHGGTSERVGCRTAVNGAAPTASIVIGTTTAANTTYTSGPGFGALAPGDSVGVDCIVFSFSSPPDDIVRFHSIEFRYTAAQ